jgi:NTE family protein
LARQKEILYSSRTRADTNAFRAQHQTRARLRDALRRVPPDALTNEDKAFLAETENAPQVSIIHLIYQRRAHEGQSQDYEFSRASMLDHWRAGEIDAFLTLSKPTRLDLPQEDEAVRVFDIHDPRNAGE